MITVGQILDYLKEFAPLELAAEWDNVGLLLGDPAAEVRAVMTCLTLTGASAAEAVERGAQLIVTHHPILFRATQRLTTATPEGRMLLALTRAGIAVYCPHTALDNAQGGINDVLARRLGLVEVAPLQNSPGVLQCKIVVFVPDADLARVSDALFSAGAGVIGQYRECSFRLAGTGTFFGSESSNPTVGQKGRREEASEWRVEVICPEAQVERTVLAMRRAHSYEEPAYDVYPLRPAAGRGGIGRLGRLPQPVPLTTFAQTVKAALSAAAVQVIGDPNRPVQRVAIVCGAGGSFLGEAIRRQADVFLTGEMRFHDYLAAQAEGVSLVLPGHYATERCGVEELALLLKQSWPALTIWASQRESDPAHWLS
jgi:dinuclear metal center YbgI/SA1388 family protein